jgi:hypothetical protein
VHDNTEYWEVLRVALQARNWKEKKKIPTHGGMKMLGK